MMHRIATLALALGLLTGCALGQSTSEPTGSIQGVIFTTEQDHARSVLPATKLSLDGTVHLEAESNSEGAFVFSKVPAGSYTITAQAPGLIASQNVEVRAGSIARLELEMTVQAVTQSTTVTANTEPVEIKESSGSNTIGGSAIEHMPNRDDHFENLLPLVPGVVRGPNGRINMKGARASQNGSLVNSADVTDPATGTTAINIPIDVVSKIDVLSTPYSPEYGKFTGAVSNVETRPGDFNKFRMSVQNLIPSLRRLDGSVMGIAGFTPRMTVSGPLVKDRVAFTESVEYRYERSPITSLPPLESDTQSEAFDSYTQLDFNISKKQTATASFAVFPQKFQYYGLNTFTPQASTPDLHGRGFQAYLQHRYVTDGGDLLTSQVSFRRFDADLQPNSDAPYQLLVETTQGGFFNHQDRDTTRVEWQEIFRSHPYHLYGTHELSAGVNVSHSSYDGRQEFLPVQIVGVAGYPLEQIQFGPKSNFSIGQNENAWFIGDKWAVSNRLSFDLGLRFDHDSITGSVNTAPRVGFILGLTADGKTMLKGGAGFFYDRIPLNVATFSSLPTRTVTALDQTGGVLRSTRYSNIVPYGLRNPRSAVWNLEVDRQVTNDLLVRVAYQQRNTVRDLFLDPISLGQTGILALSDRGGDIYKEFQLTGRYRIGRSTVNGSFVRSRAFGELNDFNQFFGNDPQAVIQPNQRGRLNFDAPNRVLVWGEIAVPFKFTFSPILEIHSGFPYSTINQQREFVGPRNEQRFPRFASMDLQVLRDIRLPFKEKHARVGFGVFNVFNRANYRDVQNDIDSQRYGQFFNGVGRTFHGKFVLGF